MDRARRVAVHGLKEQELLVAEDGVDAGRGHAHRRRQVRERNPFVPVPSEQEHRLLQGGFAIERQRSARFPSALAAAQEFHSDDCSDDWLICRTPTAI